MELLRNLFEGFPNLWGGGVAHSVLILSLVIACGIILGKIKVAGISLGVTWILFVGIVFGHFNCHNSHKMQMLFITQIFYEMNGISAFGSAGSNKIYIFCT